jgi:hypothetical protein
MSEQLFECYFCHRWVDYDITCTANTVIRQCCDNCAAQYGEDEESVAFQNYLVESFADRDEPEIGGE